MSGSVSGGAVDFGEDVLAAGKIGFQAFAFGSVSAAEVAQEDLGCCLVLGSDGSMAGVVGGLRAARGVAHPDQRLLGVRSLGELQTECP